jgi:hypothetical protein
LLGLNGRSCGKVAVQIAPLNGTPCLYSPLLTKPTQYFKVAANGKFVGRSGSSLKWHHGGELWIHAPPDAPDATRRGHNSLIYIGRRQVRRFRRVFPGVFLCVPAPGRPLQGILLKNFHIHPSHPTTRRFSMRFMGFRGGPRRGLRRVRHVKPLSSIFFRAICA